VTNGAKAVTNEAKALCMSENLPLSKKHLHGLTIGLILRLGNTDLKGIMLEYEQVVKVHLSLQMKDVF